MTKNILENNGKNTHYNTECPIYIKQVFQILNHVRKAKFLNLIKIN